MTIGGLNPLDHDWRTWLACVICAGYVTISIWWVFWKTKE